MVLEVDTVVQVAGMAVARARSRSTAPDTDPAGAAVVDTTTMAMAHGLRFYGYPFVGYGAYYDGDGGYSEGCGWLRRRALATGSRYWWARYEDCVDDNY